MADAQKGDEIAYRSIAGPVYDAVVTAVGPPGFVDLDVEIGAKEPWPLRAIRQDRLQPRSR